MTGCSPSKGTFLVNSSQRMNPNAYCDRLALSSPCKISGAEMMSIKKNVLKKREKRKDKKKKIIESGIIGIPIHATFDVLACIFTTSLILSCPKSF